MTEKLPPHKRPDVKMVGTASDKEKRKRVKEYNDRFGEKHFFQFPAEGKDLKAAEYELRPHEGHFISRANEITNGLRERFGLQPFDMPEENFHVLPPDKYVELGGSADTYASTNIRMQAVLARATEFRLSPILAAGDVLHEIVHIKGAFIEEAHNTKESDEVNIRSKDAKKQKIKGGPYRVGFEVFGTYVKAERENKSVPNSFEGLNEAVVAEIEKRFLPRVLEGAPGIEEEIDRLNSPGVWEAKAEVATRAKRDISEIYWISENGEDARLFSYYHQRQVLYFLVNCIAEDNPDMSKDEIMDMFFEGEFTGHLIEIVRKIKQAFGDDAFRFIGTMTKEDNSARLTLDYLKKKRRLLLKRRAFQDS